MKKLLDELVFLRISPMSAVYSTNNVVTNCKKNWKEIEKKVEISKNQKSFPFLTVRVVIGLRKFSRIKKISFS